MKQASSDLKTFIGARPDGDGVFFRVWAPGHASVAVQVEGAAPARHVLVKEGDGYHSGRVAGLAAGTTYRYLLGDDPAPYPDPASRYQPAGPHGPSQVVDGAAFAWSDAGWRGVPEAEHIIYELHVGTFTAEGTWRAAAAELPELARLGVTTIEMLPVADFTGRFGWGYDGVNLFAPTRLYGAPDDLKFFVNEAHRLGLAVLLDVVYNHFGPDGNYIAKFSSHYFSETYKNEWGEAPNYDDAHAQPVRDFVLANVAYWIGEFHFDGLRLDATQNIYDASPKHLLTEIAEAAKAAGKGREIFIVAENEPQDTRLVRAQRKGGYSLSAMANDDFHHSALVALTGRNEAYYSDHLGTPQEFVSLAKRGFLFQGQRYDWQKAPRGTSTRGVPLFRFVNFIENHDQIANSGRGYRAYSQTSPGRHRAVTALMLLTPPTPMLFQGQDFGSSRPFYYFADHGQELAEMVNKGRVAFLSQFPSLATAEMKQLMPDPANPETFVHSKLDHSERALHQKIYLLHQDLIALRRADRVFAQPAGGLDGAVLGAESFVLRCFGVEDDDRLLLVNFGRDLHYSPAPEPLLAPPAGRRWDVAWSSEDPKYGGQGTAPPYGEQNWRLPGHAAIAMRAVG